MNKNLLTTIIIIAIFVLIIAQSLMFTKIITKPESNHIQTSAIKLDKCMAMGQNQQNGRCLNKEHMHNKNRIKLENKTPKSSANQELAWGISGSKALETIALKASFIDKESIYFKNQIVISQKATLSYFFNEDKLWRKIISFEDGSRPNMLKLHKMLTKKYGEPLKGYDMPTWQNYDSTIFIYCDSDYLHLVYDDSEARDAIMAKVEKSQLKEL